MLYEQKQIKQKEISTNHTLAEEQQVTNIDTELQTKSNANKSKSANQRSKNNGSISGSIHCLIDCFVFYVVSTIFQ